MSFIAVTITAPCPSPMTSEELITVQAEAVYAVDPGLPGYAPRVWAYRNTKR